MWLCVCALRCDAKADAPSVREMGPFLFGYLPTYSKFGLEPSCAGSCRLFTSGVVKVICFDFKGLWSALDVQTDQCMHTLMKATTAETAERVLGNVKCWHGFVDASEDMPKALIVPPGYYVCLSPVNGLCAGVRKPFLSFGGTSTDSMAKIKDCKIDGFGKAAEIFHTLMSAAAAKHKIAEVPTAKGAAKGAPKGDVAKAKGAAKGKAKSDPKDKVVKK